ncbi:MAG: hypothetical protein LVQ64_00900 [Thermoplasmatales archaeon]|nr:hypothetical protein [Thermoplasmatales archaeon]
MADDRRTEVANRRAWVEATRTYIESLPSKSGARSQATPAILYRRAEQEFPASQPTWFRDGWKTMQSLFKDDLYRLRNPEKFAAGRRISLALPQKQRAVLEAHSRELTEKVFGHPEVLLGLSFNSVDKDQVHYAQQHLEAYPDIHALETALRKEESERDRLAGTPPPIWFGGVGTCPTGGEVRDSLLKKAREVTAKLYRGFPEYDGKGNPAPRCILINEIIEDAWLEIERSEQHSTAQGYDLTLEPVDSHWRVCRPHGKGFVMVPSKTLGKSRELGMSLRHLTSLPDLHRSYRAVQDARRAVSDAQAAYLLEVRKLGTKLGHGFLIEGLCDLGY